MEKLIIDNIRELLEAGLEIKLTKNSITINEKYKSCSRENYIEQPILECFGGIEYFSKGALRITEEKLKNVLLKLTQPTK